MSFFTELLNGLRATFTWYFIVTPWERAVRVRWGKHNELLGPGLHLRVPIRDRVYRQSIRLRSTETLGQNLTTADGRIVTIAFVVEWAIADLLQIFSTITQPERTIATRVKALVAEHVARHELVDIDPVALAEAITASVAKLPWGLSEVRVYITEFVSTAKTYRFIQGGHGYTEIDHQTHWDADLLTATGKN